MVNKMSNTRTFMKSLLITIASLLMLAAVGTAQAQPFAYITNQSNNNVSVINTATNTVVATVAVGAAPFGVGVNPAGTSVFITNRGSNDVSVIDTTTNTVVATVVVGTDPQGVAVNPAGTRAYVANNVTSNVSVIDTTTNTVVATVAVGNFPFGVAVNPAGTRAYVANFTSNNVSVIDTATNTVIATVAVGTNPRGVAVNPAGTRAYVANFISNNVSVVDTSTNTVINTVVVGAAPDGVAVNPAGTRAYVANSNSNNVSVIDTTTNTVVTTVAVGVGPRGVAVNPAGTRAYVANQVSGNVSVIDTATNMVIATLTVGTNPFAFGVFIRPATVPGAPTIGPATAGNASATVSYTAPVSDGGSSIFTYTATSNPGGITGSTTSGPILVTGLTNGTAYTFTVTATNTVGTSPPSAASNSVTPTASSATYAPPAGLDFGMRTAGVVSPSMQATFTNTSAVSLLVSSVSFNGGGAGFNVLGSSQCLTPMLVLAPATSCTFDITSQPNALGVLTDSVFVVTAPANAATPLALPLTVTGVAPSPVLAIVTNTADSGAGSLRQAITDANAGGFCASSATINFSIPGGGVKVITPFSPLPTLLCPSTIIDGYSQPGASANTLGVGNNAAMLIALDGTSMTPAAPGLALKGNNILVRGMNIRKFIGKPGIDIQGGAGVKIEGNFIGTDELGTSAAANGTGIGMSSGTFAAIGNAAPAGRNLISGNSGTGIALTGASGPTGTQIRNNYIGTDTTGATALANGGGGILLNVPNTDVDGNFIRYNVGNGVKIVGIVGSSGGPANIHDNDILANTGNGIYLAGSECAPAGVSIRRNNIGFQFGLGIDLGDTLIGSARDTNLAVSTCFHGNGGQNYPVITSVTHAWNGAVATSTVNATLNSGASTPYTIDLFNNLGAVDSGNRGVAAKYVSSLTTPATNAMGFVSFQLVTTGLPVYHPTVTSTTPVGPSGGTSEISVQAVTPLVYTSTYSNFSIVAGAGQSQTFTFLNADAATVVVPLPTSSSTGFTITSSTCGSVLPGGTCQVVVTYLRAVSTTTETATLTIGPITSASMPVLPVAVQPAVTYTWALTGVATAPLVAVSSTSLTFASTAQGTQSLPQTVTVTNAGASAITLAAASASPTEFLISATSCGTSLASMSSCTITVQLSPSATSAPATGFTGGLNLSTSAGSLIVGLSGTIASYSATALPSPVAFPNTVVSTNSASQTVTFTNNSSGTVNIVATAVNITGTNIADFQVVSTTCAGIVNPTATCTAAVRFRPQSLGAKTANVRFDSGGLSTLASLTGTGVQAVPVITSPTTAGGVTGSAFTYSITATNSPTSFGASGLPAGLTVNTTNGVISGSPSVTGPFTATITATNAGGTGSQTLSITITAATVAPTITFATTPTSIIAGGSTVGTMTITNSNATPLTANSFTSFYLAGLVNAAVPNATSNCSGASITASPGGGSFSQSTSFIIPASGSCTFTSTVTTGTPGTYTGAIPAGLIVTGAGSSAASNSVTLIVTVAPTPAVTLAPANINFGTRTVNTTSPPTPVTLTNSGTGPLTISNISGSGNFGFTSTCPISTPPLTAAGTCEK